jgi:hypothetical protein
MSTCLGISHAEQADSLSCVGPETSSGDGILEIMLR